MYIYKFKFINGIVLSNTTLEVPSKNDTVASLLTVTVFICTNEPRPTEKSIERQQSLSRLRLLP